MMIGIAKNWEELENEITWGKLNALYLPVDFYDESKVSNNPLFESYDPQSAEENVEHGVPLRGR